MARPAVFGALARSTWAMSALEKSAQTLAAADPPPMSPSQSRKRPRATAVSSVSTDAASTAALTSLHTGVLVSFCSAWNRSTVQSVRRESASTSRFCR